MGALARTGVHALLSRSDLLVVSSLHETFCVAAAEALAFGIPVVTTRCGGPEGFVTPECGCVVEAGDATALADGIRDVISRLGTFDAVAIRRNIVDRFGPTAFLSQIDAIYGEVLGVATQPSSRCEDRVAVPATGWTESR